MRKLHFCDVLSFQVPYWFSGRIIVYNHKRQALYILNGADCNRRQHATTNIMRQAPRKICRSSAQDILGSLRNPWDHYRYHNSPPKNPSKTLSNVLLYEGSCPLKYEAVYISKHSLTFRRSLTIYQSTQCYIAETSSTSPTETQDATRCYNEEYRVPSFGSQLRNKNNSLSCDGCIGTWRDADTMMVLEQNNRVFLVAIDKLQRQYWVWHRNRSYRC
jgi:hypothetical protein